MNDVVGFLNESNQSLQFPSELLVLGLGILSGIGQLRTIRQIPGKLRCLSGCAYPKNSSCEPLRRR